MNYKLILQDFFTNQAQQILLELSPIILVMIIIIIIVLRKRNKEKNRVRMLLREEGEG